MKAKLNNGQLEYFKQPAWLLGDATTYATEHGYKEVVCVQSELSSSRAQQVCVALNQKQPDSYFFSNSKSK